MAEYLIIKQDNYMFVLLRGGYQTLRIKTGI